MVLVVDPQIAGVSGDMFLCSLVDLGADQKAIVDGVRDSARFLEGSVVERMEFRPVQKHGIRALGLVLDARDLCDAPEADAGGDRGAHTGSVSHGSRTGAEMLNAVRRSTEGLGLSSAASSFAASCINTLVGSESRVHGVSLDSVIFHEASCVDTLVDIVGAAIGLDCLNVFGERVVVMPVCVGGGTLTFSHGTVSNPAGAILEILAGSGLAIRGSPAGAELTTPTGACILAGLSPEGADFYPLMRVDSVGYGAGSMDFEGFSNVLKMVRGEGAHVLDGRQTDTVCMLETNVDDVSGEILGILVERLMGAGAKDVTICPGLTKKGRPTNLVSVMCEDSASGRLVEMLISETGTLGVRISESVRITVPRRSYHTRVELAGRWFDVRYKKSLGGEFKIESDDLQSVSDALGMPVRRAESELRRLMVAKGCGDAMPREEPAPRPKERQST